MRFYLSILLLTSLLLSCQQDKVRTLDGYWFRYADGEIENSYFPFELHYKDDSLIMIDGHNFTHLSKYLVDSDTLILTFSNGSQSRINFKIESDSIHFFGNGKFIKGSEAQFTSVPSYDLIRYKTNQILKNDNVASSIHLIKKYDSVKVILNDITTDLRDIEQFLRCHDCQNALSVNLYIGKDIEFVDLLSAYKLIAATGIRRVTLIMANNGFDNFYIEKDYINIDDSLMKELFEKEGRPPSPPAPKRRDSSRIILAIKGASDFDKLNTMKDSLEYLVQIDPQISLLDYLELNQRTKDKQNVKKEVKRLTTKCM